MKINITKVKDGSFPGEDGQGVIKYFWHKAQRFDSEGTPIAFEFGSPEEHAVGECDLELEKYEKKNGQMGWREVR